MRTTAAFLIKRPFLLLLLFLLAAYLPVFLPFFHIKNDLITQNLPTRFVTSESLYSGYFPWWNPYINFGIPQYGDMNDGYWNPFQWLIACTSGYGIWAITLEEMMYILLGGWGIYLLCRDNLGTKPPAIIAAISYMTCGFILGHLQHFCWITGTAFFPYMLLYFFRIHRAPTVKNFIIGGWCVFLFIASTHPGLVIGAFYFFLLLILAVFGLRKDIAPGYASASYWRSNLVFLLVSLLFSLVVIISDMDILPHISRGSIIPLGQSLLHPTTFPSYLSLLFPLAVQKGDAFFQTDIAMRNTYTGIFLFICFIVFCIYARRKMLLATGLILIFFILLSSGGIFKTFAYHFLPFTGHVRLNGEFNYFVVLTLVLAGAAGFHYCIKNLSSGEKAKALITPFKGLFLAALVISAAFIFFTRHSLLHAPSPPSGDLKQHIKWLIDEASIWDMIFFQSLIQLVTLSLIRRYWGRQYSLVIVIAIHQMILSWCILPFTGLGMAGKASRQALISYFPKGIHAPEQKALISTAYLDSSYAKDLMLLGSYSKKIGYLKKEAYPIELSTTEQLFQDSALFHFILRQSYLFLSTDTILHTATAFDSSLIHVREFGPGLIQTTVDNPGYRYLTFLQNDYPWWTVSVNGSAVPHFTGFKTFITVPLQPGKQNIQFTFNPRPIKKALWIQLFIAFVTMLLLCSRRIRHLRLSQPSLPSLSATS